MTELIRAASLTHARASLGRFSAAKLDRFLTEETPESFDAVDKLKGGFLSQKDAKSLWDYLGGSRHIERALKERGVKKTTLYGIREVANAMLGFYGGTEEEQDTFAEWGLEGHYVCYKRSFRTGFMVKSRFEIRRSHRELFEIRERQRSSGRFSSDMISAGETTVGFGFIKTKKLWIFGREEEHEQPRLFCFDKHRRSTVGDGPQEKIVSLRGWVMEGTLKTEPGFFRSRAWLSTVDNDRKLWEVEHKEDGKLYDENEHFDLFPYTPETLEKYGHLSKIRIPKIIVDYIEHEKSPD